MAEELKQIIRHFLVPDHIKLTPEQRDALLKKFNISIKQLPMIQISDPALLDRGFNVGDVILIKRKSLTTKEADYYRVVVDG